MRDVRPFTDEEKRYLQQMRLWRPELELVGREDETKKLSDEEDPLFAPLFDSTEFA